jgi:hypothetical protein
LEPEFMALYDYLIQKVEQVFNSCCEQINKFFDQNEAYFSSKYYELDREEIKANALNSYCLFINNNILNSEFKSLNPIGLLVCCDWYLDENQLNFIR